MRLDQSVVRKTSAEKPRERASAAKSSASHSSFEAKAQTPQNSDLRPDRPDVEAPLWLVLAAPM